MSVAVAAPKQVPLVSVIVPAYNAEFHLGDCLASVVGQVGRFSLDVVVVDDGSTDATIEVARRFPGVRVIGQANRGPSAARNVGIAAARGEYVAFLDADDVWPDGKLAAQLDILTAVPEAGMIFGDCRQFDATGPRPRTEFLANGLGQAVWGPGPIVPDAYARLLEVNFITTGSVVARRAVLQEVGGFAEDLRLVEDLDLWMRIARRHAIAWCAAECLHRRRHDSNISRDPEAMALAYLEVLRRHRETWTRQEIAALRLDGGRLASQKQLYLAELAMAQGQLAKALRRTWASFVAAPRPQTVWRIAKSTLKQALGRNDPLGQGLGASVGTPLERPQTVGAGAAVQPDGLHSAQRDVAPVTAASGFLGVLQADAAAALPPRVIAPTELRCSSAGRFAVAVWGHGPQAPAWLHAGDVSLAVHGTVLNTRELGRALGLADDAPVTAVLLAGWRRWRDALPGRLDGMFALAVRDGVEAFLYCDPSGLTAIYVYRDTSGGLAFATDLGVLLQLPGVPQRLARRSLHEYLRFLDVSAPHTMVEGVTAVKGGQLLRWPRGGLALAPGEGATAWAGTGFEQAVDALDARLQHSVRTHLAGCARPAAFLSGGVDSALLCALAARQRPDLVAITVGFDTAGFDEAPVAAAVAAHLGLRHEVLRFTRQDYLAALGRFCAGAEQPMADPASLATLLAAEYCLGRHDVVIDGTGGDEAAGMMPPRHVRLAVRASALLPVAVRRALTVVTRKVPGMEGFTPIVGFEHPAETMIRWRGFTRREVEALCDEPVSFDDTTFYQTYHRHEGGLPFDLYSALVDTMPSDRLTQAMRLTGVPLAFPFFDREVDRFLRALPQAYRYQPGQPKRILRALLGRYVPASLWALPKHGFDFPLHGFLAEDNHAVVRQYLGGAAPGLRGVLRTDRVQHYLRQFIAGDTALTFRVWALVVLAAWMEQHALDA